MAIRSPGRFNSESSLISVVVLIRAAAFLIEKANGVSAMAVTYRSWDHSHYKQWWSINSQYGDRRSTRWINHNSYCIGWANPIRSRTNECWKDKKMRHQYLKHIKG